MSEEFPYEEIRDNGRDDGDYWHTVADALAAGYALDQIWSVTIEDEDNGTWFCYGPSHHYVNVIGYTVTRERHDGETYFTEWCELEDEGEWCSESEH